MAVSSLSRLPCWVDNARVAFVGVLGPLVVRAADGAEVRLGSRRQRRLLSALVLYAGTVAERDRLVELVWDGALPADPANALQTNVARLRRALPPAVRITTEPDGYRLAVHQPDAIDVRVFDQVLGTVADRNERLAKLDEALALWRGRPYAELDHPLVSAELVRLSELRAAALELRAEELLVDGRTGRGDRRAGGPARRRAATRASGRAADAGAGRGRPAERRAAGVPTAARRAGRAARARSVRRAA